MDGDVSPLPWMINAAVHRRRQPRAPGQADAAGHGRGRRLRPRRIRAGPGQGPHRPGRRRAHRHKVTALTRARPDFRAPPRRAAGDPGLSARGLPRPRASSAAATTPTSPATIPSRLLPTQQHQRPDPGRASSRRPPAPMVDFVTRIVGWKFSAPLQRAQLRGEQLWSDGWDRRRTARTSSARSPTCGRPSRSTPS